MPENSLSGGRYTVGKRFGASIQYVAVMAGSSSFCQQKQHPAATSIFHYRQTTHRAVRNKCWFCINIRREQPDFTYLCPKMPVRRTNNACAVRADCLCGSRTMLVRLANNACMARPDCLWCSSEPVAATKNSVFRTNSGRFFSISIVNISLPI